MNDEHNTIRDRAIAAIHARNPVLNAWASTLPYSDDRIPRSGTECAVGTCGCTLRAGEECYLVTEMPDDAWVCWRHIARESGSPRPVFLKETA